MPNIDLSILNQRQTPAFYADVFANRPAAGFVGRIFVSTNTFAFYRDNGTSWDLIGGPGTGTVTGTGANGQVTYWNGASTITGSNDLFWDATNGHLGVNTNAPGTALDVHHDQPTVAILNQTVATNDVRIGFQNNGVGLWRIGAFYNAGANDFGIYDAVAAIQPVTVKKTTGQVLIGTSTVGSGKLVVASSIGDNGVQIVGASAPSLRIDNAESGPTKRAGFGISTATNNFIQGSADRDFCMFNGSTTASPILFGIYGTTNVQEAARISAARNFLIGTTTDGGQRLQISGSARATSYYLDGMTAGSGALYWSSDRVTLANYNIGGTVLIEVNGGATALTIQSNLDAIFEGDLGIGVIPSAGGLSSYKLFEIANGGASIYSGPNQNLNGTNISWSGGTASYKISNFATLYNQQSGQHQFSVAPSGIAGNPITFTTALTITSAGNVGIGGTSPQSNLSIGGNGYTGRALTAIANNNDYAVTFQQDNASGGGLQMFSTAASFGADIIRISDATTTQLNLKATGNLLIGTTTDAGQKLQVNGKAYITDKVLIGTTTESAELYVQDAAPGNMLGVRNTNATFGATIGFFGADRNTTNNSFYYIDCYNYGSSSYRFRVADSGNATNVTGSYGSISDISLKENITDATEKLNDILNVKIKNYNLIGNNEKHIGVIAQELETIFPKLVDIDEKGIRSVKYSIFIPILIKAIQELNTKIENLK